MQKVKGFFAAVIYKPNLSLEFISFDFNANKFKTEELLRK